MGSTMNIECGIDRGIHSIVYEEFLSRKVVKIKKIKTWLLYRRLLTGCYESL
jgi:hypothetical protein